MDVQALDPDMRRAIVACCWAAAIVCVLALLCFVRWQIERRRNLKRACLETHGRFLEAVEEGRAQAAYGLMDSRYRGVRTLSQFRGRMDRYASGGQEQWQCLRMWKDEGRWKCEVGERNAAGFFVGLVYQYELESGEWRFTGSTRECVD